MQIIISKEKISERVIELGKKITSDYQNKSLIVLCTLKGSIIFFADLIREIELELETEFIRASSYGKEKTSSGDVKLAFPSALSLIGKHVLLVEDIIDTGMTLDTIVNSLHTRNPASIRVCSLLLKKDAAKPKTQIDYVGFEIGNEFVVGYGLDYAEKYRNLNDICII